MLLEEKQSKHAGSPRRGLPDIPKKAVRSLTDADEERHEENRRESSRGRKHPSAGSTELVLRWEHRQFGVLGARVLPGRSRPEGRDQPSPAKRNTEKEKALASVHRSSLLFSTPNPRSALRLEQDPLLCPSKVTNDREITDNSSDLFAFPFSSSLSFLPPACFPRARSPVVRRDRFGDFDGTARGADD